MEEQKEKRVLRVELNDDVKHVSITGKDSEENVVMRRELSEDELELPTGGGRPPEKCQNDHRHCKDYSRIPTIGCTFV